MPMAPSSTRGSGACGFGGGEGTPSGSSVVVVAATVVVARVVGTAVVDGTVAAEVGAWLEATVAVGASLPLHAANARRAATKGARRIIGEIVSCGFVATHRGGRSLGRVDARGNTDAVVAGAGQHQIWWQTALDVGHQ